MGRPITAQRRIQKARNAQFPPERPPEIRTPAEVDKRLAALKAHLLSQGHLECAWELFRLQYFSGWKHTEIAGALGAWSRRQAITVEFQTRNVHNVDVIFMVFSVTP